MWFTLDVKCCMWHVFSMHFMFFSSECWNSPHPLATLRRVASLLSSTMSASFHERCQTLGLNSSRPSVVPTGQNSVSVLRCLSTCAKQFIDSRLYNSASLQLITVLVHVPAVSRRIIKRSNLIVTYPLQKVLDAKQLAWIKVDLSSCNSSDACFNVIHFGCQMLYVTCLFNAFHVLFFGVLKLALIHLITVLVYVPAVSRRIKFHIPKRGGSGSWLSGTFRNLGKRAGFEKENWEFR